MIVGHFWRGKCYLKAENVTFLKKLANNTGLVLQTTLLIFSVKWTFTQEEPEQITPNVYSIICHLRLAQRLETARTLPGWKNG